MVASRYGGLSRNLRDDFVNHKHEAEGKVKIEQKLSKFTPIDILPAARLHDVNLPKQYQQLGAKCLNTHMY